LLRRKVGGVRIVGFTVRVHVHAEPFEAAHVHHITVPVFLQFQFLFACRNLQHFKGFELDIFVGFRVFFLRAVLFIDAVDDAPFQVLLPGFAQSGFVCSKSTRVGIVYNAFGGGVVEWLFEQLGIDAARTFDAGEHFGVAGFEKLGIGCKEGLVQKRSTGGQVIHFPLREKQLVVV